MAMFRYLRLYKFDFFDLLFAVCLLLNVPLLIYTMLALNEVKTFSGWRAPVVDISASEKLVELMEPAYREARCYYYALQAHGEDTLSPFLTVYPSGKNPDWYRAISIDSTGVLNILTFNGDAQIVLSGLSGPIRGVAIKRASAEEFWQAKGFLGRGAARLDAEEEGRFEIRRNGNLSIGTISDGVRFLFLFCVPLNTVLLLCSWFSSRRKRAEKERLGAKANVCSTEMSDGLMSKVARFVSLILSFGFFLILSAGFLLATVLIVSGLLARATGP